MIMNGRYAVLYGKLAPELQQQVIARMAELIEEDKGYEDKGNYGHLCNILPTIAIDDVLQRSGKSADEAFEMTSSHMWAALTPEMFQKMSKLPFFLSVMRKIIPLGFKYGSGKGWKYVWHPEDPKEYYHFETLECLYKHLFTKHGVLERFGPMFCHSDIIVAAASLFVPNQTVSTILGGFAFSCFWGILEMHQQEQRVVKGWFPENPKRHDYYKSLRKKSLK